MSEDNTSAPAPIETTGEPAPAAPSGGGDVDSALRALAASKGLEYGGEPAVGPADVPDPDEAPPPAAAAAKPAVAAKDVPLDKYARMEAKAREHEAAARASAQRLAELEQQRSEEENAWKADPIAALHRRGLSTTDLNKRALDLGEPKPDAPAEALPAWAQELKRKNDELESWRTQEMQARQQNAQQQQVAAQTNILKEHLGKFEEFALVNEMGAHDAVYKRITQHLAGGRFEDDEQAATVIAAIAREEETRLQAQFREYIGKPKVRAFLERELKGKQIEAKPSPARTPGPTRVGNDARPANGATPAQRTALRPEPDEGWSRDDAMKRALEEASALSRAG